MIMPGWRTKTTIFRIFFFKICKFWFNFWLNFFFIFKVQGFGLILKF